MSALESPPRPPRRAGLLRAPNDLMAALFLLACAGCAWFFGKDLSIGSAFRMGPGYVPRLLTWIMLGFGVLLLVRAFVWPGPALERWPIRPIALTIERGGLLAASALTVALAALASPQNRWRGALTLALCLTAAACVLFPWLLQLPLRILPK